jgi:drug/metabolite transporter (DMT)-like permease
MPGLLPGQILIPLVAAFLYALATIFLKRALQDGTGSWRVTFVSNMVMALGYQVCWLVHKQPFSGICAFHAALAACAFFSGQVFTFLALKRGDVSLATPILGTKVIWVAAFSVLLIGRALPPLIWVAVFLTALGTAVLGCQPGRHPSRVALSIGTALATSCSFGLTDVLVMKYAPAWGFGSFIPTMFAVVGLLSLGFLPILDGKGWAPVWLGTGSAILAVQALGMAFAISTFGHVTTVNIAYSSRGLWSVVLIWLVGHWFGNTERDQGSRTMLLRLAGAALLVTAIFIASS